MAPKFQAYDNVTAAQHQTQFNTLSQQGYRLVSLSVYGDPGSPFYAAVWVQESGPAWVAIHGANTATLQSWTTNTVQAQNYVITLISATGPVSNAVFAAVAEQNGLAWQCKIGLTDGGTSDPNSFQTFCAAAASSGQIVQSAAIYGDASQTVYAAAAVSNPGSIQWSYVANVDGTGYQNAFNASLQASLRPAYAAVSGTQQYVAIFRNDIVGPFQARAGLTSAELQAQFNQLKSQGYYPACIQGGGSGSSTTFAAIFAQQTSPVARQWTVTGPAVSYLGACDTTMANFMQPYGVRAGQLAIVRNGTLVFSRGYTWGEPGYYATTQPTSVFRLASCSKAFTCAAITNLTAANTILSKTAAFPYLGITAAALSSQTPDANINSITVQNLVDHAGGWNDTESRFDPVFNLRAIASAFGLPRPPRKMEMAAYMYGEPLQFNPGTQSYATNKQDYSNFGYVLLGLIIEQASGMPYVDFVRQHVLAPLGLTDVYLARMEGGPVQTQEVSYDDPAIGLTPYDYSSNLLLPNTNGGEGSLTELMDSGGGLMTSAQTLAQFIHTNAVWGLGGRAPGAARDGSMDGTSTWAESRTDGVDWAAAFNTRWQVGRVIGTDAQGNSITPLSQFTSAMDAALSAVTWP